ncbi:AraC family transcriptional regulator [Novosphingobium sp. Gsoil 351]|uniref:AraC family transcriptional regulator n=1 Tax=Novosphingobium sp. Gsoil 351 TaxID=2675225 RepID=UPI0012B4F13D|nr:helix-turn-helix domain-containing protein [Novosphingobium sp. Gsoil 351]QGN54861.1 helix-turn-helix domain-containing protein [Novosphingobium sp. Gsoil 351]
MKENGSPSTAAGGNAADPVLEPLTGETRDGLPLSLNRAAAPDVSPWVARIMSAEVRAPAGTTIRCNMFNDAANLRVLFHGRWGAETVDGPASYNLGNQGQALFFGPLSKCMPITVDGSFKVAGLSLRPGAEYAMGGMLPSASMDRIIDFDGIVGHGRLGDRFDVAAGHDAWADRFEELLREFIALRRPPPPDPVTTAFDRFAFASPDAPVSEFIATHGVTQRTLERIVKRDFGMTPKQVLRRARVLDMASQLLGVAAPDEAEALALRFFDQSHLIREFSHFFGMTPQQLTRRANPLLRITLEGRQARRLEELRRIEPGATPWRAGPA